MKIPRKPNREVTLPDGAGLGRIGQVLLDAWEANPRRWMKEPPHLREGATASKMPAPQDAIELFRLLAERRVGYLLVGGMAMLTYVKGRNTKDVDLLISVAALEQVPELKIEDQNDFFARGEFRSIQVDLLLTKNPLFRIVAERFATHHQFEEMSITTATVEGLIVLKLYALPSLYRQFDWERIHVYESDVKILLALYRPDTKPLFELLEKHLPATDLKELRKIVSEEQQRIARTERDSGIDS